MNVLITGGAGYIGSHCNRYFNEKGIYTVIVDDLSDGHEESVVAGKFVKGSFGDRALMEKILKEEKIDAVIHFAAFASVPDSVARPSRYYHNNVSNMLNLLDAMVATGGEVHRIFLLLLLLLVNRYIHRLMKSIRRSRLIPMA